MPITDKVAAAKQIGEFLQAVISNGGFKLKYRITVDPPIANGSIRKFWWSSPGRIRRCSWSAAASCCGRLSCSHRRFCTSRATNTRKSGSTAKTSGRCGSTSCNWQRVLRRSRCAVPASRTGLDLCHRASGGSFILRCARKKICALRVTARVDDGRWLYIRATTRRRHRYGGSGTFRKCTLCAAVSFSTLDSEKKSRFDKALMPKFFVITHRRGDFFMLVCRSSRNKFHRQPVRQNCS
jgi:hypothetical protein